MEIVVQVSTGVKCPRCWHYHHLKENFDNLCDRCSQVMIEGYPNDERVSKIKAALKEQQKKYCVRPDDQPCPHVNCCRNDDLIYKS